MFLKNNWYIACLLDELNKKNIVSKKICNENILIFKNNKNQIAVIEDRCCHRNVQLSLGYIHGENIKCGYHGWEYNGDGKCVHIPSLDLNSRIPNSACLKKYYFTIKYKCVWVWLGDSNLANEKDIPPLKEFDEYSLVYNYHTLKADLAFVAESLFDAYHINHVHRNSISTFMGNLYDEKIDFHVQKTEKSLTGKYFRKNDGTFFEKFYFGFNKMVETHFGFWFPNISKLDIRFKKRHMVIYEHFYQIDEENVGMCQITLWKNILDFFPPFARWFMLRKSIKIVREDIGFLENNLEIKKRYKKSDLLIPSDEVSFEFMKLWKENVKSQTNEKLD